MWCLRPCCRGRVLPAPSSGDAGGHGVGGRLDRPAHRDEGLERVADGLPARTKIVLKSWAQIVAMMNEDEAGWYRSGHPVCRKEDDS